MTEYHIGNVGRGEVPTVTDKEIAALRPECLGGRPDEWRRLIQTLNAELGQQRKWAAAWKAVAKKYHEYHVLVHDCNMRCHGVLHSWMKRAKKAEAELAELKAQQNER